MTRFDSSSNDDAAELPHVPYVLLVELDFSSGFVRVNSSDRAFQHQGNTFLGTGQLGSIGPVKENGDLIPEKLDFTLNGVDPAYITTTLTENYHGRDIRVWLGLLDEELALIDTPELMWEGEMDVMNIHRGRGEASIQLIGENRLIRWSQNAGLLMTHEHQRQFDDTDDFFNLVETLPNKKVRWGGNTVTAGHMPSFIPAPGRPRDGFREP